MNLEDLIGQKEKIKILQLTSSKKYYLSEIINKDYKIYIENDEEYEPEELIGTIQDCLITRVVDNNLVGFILSNRKFENDLKRINSKLITTKEYDSVKDIYLMERLKIKDKIVGLYMVDENDIGKYYLGTIEIGTYIKKLRDNNIIFKDRKIEDELGKQIKDVVQSIDLNKKEISLREQEERQKELIEHALGIDQKNITRIATLSLKQVIDYSDNKDKEKLKNLEDNKNNINKQMELNQSIKNINLERSTTKDVAIKQQTNLEGKITDFKTLGQVLDKNGKLPHIEGKKFTKMGVIESDDRDKLKDINGKNAEKNTTRYSLVAIANDGTVVPLDLKQDSLDGRNPMRQNYQINHDGQVIKDDVLSRFSIGKGSFAIKNGQMGEIKIYHSQGKSIGSEGTRANMNLDRELETDNVWRMNKDQRDLASEYNSNYKSVEKSYKEAKEHENKNGEVLEGDKLKTADVDGDLNTKSHEHYNINYDEIATKWGYYNDNGKPNSQRAKEIFEEKVKENPEKSKKEIVEIVTEEIEEELHRNARTR